MDGQVKMPGELIGMGGTTLQRLQDARLQGVLSPYPDLIQSGFRVP
jgi:hypothetical protein